MPASIFFVGSCIVSSHYLNEIILTQALRRAFLWFLIASHSLPQRRVSRLFYQTTISKVKNILSQSVSHYSVTSCHLMLVKQMEHFWFVIYFSFGLFKSSIYSINYISSRNVSPSEALMTRPKAQLWLCSPALGLLHFPCMISAPMPRPSVHVLFSMKDC